MLKKSDYQGFNRMLWTNEKMFIFAMTAHDITSKGALTETGQSSNPLRAGPSHDITSKGALTETLLDSPSPGGIWFFKTLHQRAPLLKPRPVQGLRQAT